MDGSTYGRPLTAERLKAMDELRRRISGGAAGPLLIEPSAITMAAGERGRAAASPSGVRELRPGDVIVRPPSRATREVRPDGPPVDSLRSRQPVPLAALFAERSVAMRRARGAAEPPPAAPRTHVIPSQPEDLVTVFGRRQGVIDEHRAAMARRLPWEAR